jgi:hypothetical protein
MNRRYFQEPFPLGFIDDAVRVAKSGGPKPVRGRRGTWHIGMTDDEAMLLKLTHPQPFQRKK